MTGLLIFRLLGSLLVLGVALLLALLIVWPMAMRGQGWLSPGGALLVLNAVGTLAALVWLWRWASPWPVGLVLLGALVLLGLLRRMGAC